MRFVRDQNPAWHLLGLRSHRRDSVLQVSNKPADFNFQPEYFGAIRCIQAVMRPMRERGSGAIINVTSVAGKISVSPMGPYSASKFALEALSEALAQELRAFGVRVAIVEPGIIDTRMARNIEGMGGSKVYPQVRRCAALFEGDDGGRSGPATGSGPEGSGDRRVRNVAVAASGGARCGAVPGLARVDER